MMHTLSRRRCLTILASGVALAGLAACGRKSQPEHPEGSAFPQHYPYVAPSGSAASPPPPPPEGDAGRDNSSFLKLDPAQTRRY